VTITGELQDLAAFTPQKAGTYTFELMVYDGAKSSTDTVTITVTGRDAGVVFFDNFDTDGGWVINPAGTDTAVKGVFERGNPSNTTYQIGRTVSGFFDLVTGRYAGSSTGAHDLDGGISSARSPSITVPANASLSFSYYVAHSDNSTRIDYLRVKVNGMTVFDERGAEAKRLPQWSRKTVSLSAFAGQTVTITVEANDGGRSSLFEAAIDDILLLAQ
jgi:hypothetical protein